MAGLYSFRYPSTSPRMPRAVRSHSKLPMPLFAANVPGSWATISTSMLIAFSCDLITAAICWNSSGVENVDSFTEKPLVCPAARHQRPAP